VSPTVFRNNRLELRDLAEFAPENAGAVFLPASSRPVAATMIESSR
jgi:hypothetical protein